MSVRLVGVLNVTPDSFSDGGQFLSPAEALAQAEQLLADGATIVDIGAEATNPWAAAIDSAEEWQRLQPVVAALLPAHSPFTFSIDTRHPGIVEQAAKYGKFYVNDVTTFIDPAMIAVTARLGLRAIASHLPLAVKGDIAKAHADNRLASSEQVRKELLAQREAMVKGGIAASDIVLDPGIGFGKTMKLNWELLEFSRLVPGETVMIGFSRKRFLATDPATGEIVPGHDKLDPKLNVAAAKRAVAAGGELWLRVHEPSLYRELT